MIKSKHQLTSLFVIIGVLLVIAGCATTSSDWKQASSENTISAYEQFLQKHPDADQAGQAKIRIKQQLRAQAAAHNAEINAYNEKMKAKLSSYRIGSTTETAFWNDWADADAGRRYSIIRAIGNTKSAVYTIGYDPLIIAGSEPEGWHTINTMLHQALRSRALNNETFQMPLPADTHGKTWPGLRTVAILKFEHHILKQIDFKFPGVPTHQ